MDPYRPDSWHDFFLATAGASAALTGLLFVGLSLHVRFVASNTTYRNMARSSLIGLVQVLVLSLLVLIRQASRWTGFELAFVSVFVIGVGTYQLLSSRRARLRMPTATAIRGGLGFLLALTGIIGGLSLSLEVGPGLYLIAFLTIAIVVWNLTSAWSLLLGVADENLVGPEA